MRHLPLPNDYQLTLDETNRWHVVLYGNPAFPPTEVGIFCREAYKDAVAFAWGDFYRKIADEVNDETRRFGDLIWGYRLRQNKYYHPECLGSRYHKLIQVTYNDHPNLVNMFCDKCHEPLVDSDDAEEFFWDDCNFEPSEALEEYASRHSNPGNICGFRAGEAGYAAARDKTPQQYAEFLGFAGAGVMDFVAGYLDGSAES